MSGLLLHLRARGVPQAVLIVVVALGAAWAAWPVFSDSPAVDVRLVSLAVLLAVTAAAPTLAAADEALDRTAAVRWPLRRAAHLLLAALAIVALPVVSIATDELFTPFSVVLRNTAGLLGLTALGAALLDTSRSWIVPVAWTIISVTPLVAPSTQIRWQVAGWLIQPAGTTAATVTAGVLAAAGLLAYAIRGCPQRALP